MLPTGTSTGLEEEIVVPSSHDAETHEEDHIEMDNHTMELVPSLPEVPSPFTENSGEVTMPRSKAKATYAAVLVTPARQRFLSHHGHFATLILSIEEISSNDNYSEADPGSPLKRPVTRSKTGSIAIYFHGIPYLPIHDVKRLLAQKPVSIQLRHIQNVSWINRMILEILVDRNHAELMKNSISKDQDYQVRISFDPLARTSFEWESEVSPERQEAILKADFVRRIAASVASSRSDATRRYLCDWARNRGVGKQLETALAKDYEIPLPEDPFPGGKASVASLVKGKEPVGRRLELQVTEQANRFATRKRRHTTVDSIERLVVRIQLV